MANPDPSRTEKATAKKQAQERSKGNIAVSQDVTAVVTILTCTLILIILFPKFHQAFGTLITGCFSLDISREWDPGYMQGMIMEGIKLFMSSFVALMAVIFLVTIIAIRAQVGSFFDTKPLNWKFDFLNVGNGMKQLIPNKRKIVHFFLTLAKVAVVGTICYFVIKKELATISSLVSLPVGIGITIMLKMSLKVMIITLIIYIIIAILDALFKHRQHDDDLMMTKQEVKDERKNAEGDQKVKAKIRSKMRAMHVANMQSSVRKATVVITNPTHVAVALQYLPGQAAPKVVAKGLRKKALKIKEIAKNAGIPMVEAPPLARSLYRSTEVGKHIDQKFYAAVAVILAKIFKRKKVKAKV